jgi:hypothetical protein
VTKTVHGNSDEFSAGQDGRHRSMRRVSVLT